MRRGWRAVALMLAAVLARFPAAAATDRFEPAANPFQYAREYRDPAWGGVALRARWYHPSLPSFVSRDRAQEQVSHYGYASADPVMRIDPSGWRSRSLAERLARLNDGWGGHFARVFLGLFTGPLQIVAQPGAFWRALKHNNADMDIFLGGGVAAELLTSSIALPETGALLAQVPFLKRIAGEAFLGTAQTAVASFGHRMRDFHAGRFAQGMEYTFGAELVGRIGMGLGYQPYDLGGRVAADVIGRQAKTLGENEAILFRLRRRGRYVNWDTPLLEAANLGLYHEAIVAVTRNAISVTEALPIKVMDDHLPLGQGASLIRNAPVRLQYIGKVRSFDREDFFGDPLRVEHPTGDGPTTYNLVTKNCHHHVAAIRRLLSR